MLACAVSLCSQDLLRRPWCVGELSTCSLRDVDTLLTLFPDFVLADDYLLMSLQRQLDMDCPVKNAISEDMVRNALLWLRQTPQQLRLPTCLNAGNLREFVHDILFARSSTTSGSLQLSETLSMSKTVSRRSGSMLRSMSKMGSGRAVR